MIIYKYDLEGITTDMLNGFFVGWPTPPTTTTHLKILKQSSYFVLAIDDKTNKITNINQILLQDKEMLERTLTYKIQICMDFQDDLWNTWADQSQLHDAIINMCGNTARMSVEPIANTPTAFGYPVACFRFKVVD